MLTHPKIDTIYDIVIQKRPRNILKGCVLFHKTTIETAPHAQKRPERASHCTGQTVKRCVFYTKHSTANRQSSAKQAVGQTIRHFLQCRRCLVAATLCFQFVS